MPGSRLPEGDLVVFLDADDELLPDAVALGAEALATDPVRAAVVGRCQVMDAAGRPLAAIHDPVDPSNLYEEWLSRNFVWTPGAAIFRRRALEGSEGFRRTLVRRRTTRSTSGSRGRTAYG